MSIDGSVTERFPRNNNFQIVCIGASLPLHHPVEWVWWVATHCLPPSPHLAVMDWIRRFIRRRVSSSTATKKVTISNTNTTHHWSSLSHSDRIHQPTVVHDHVLPSDRTNDMRRKQSQLLSGLRDQSFLTFTSANHDRLSQSLEHIQAFTMVLHGRINIKFPFGSGISECFSLLDPLFNHREKIIVVSQIWRFHDYIDMPITGDRLVLSPIRGKLPCVRARIQTDFSFR